MKTVWRMGVLTACVAGLAGCIPQDSAEEDAGSSASDSETVQVVEAPPVDWMAEYQGDEYALYNAARDIVSEQDVERFGDARGMLEAVAEEGISDANVWLGILLTMDSPDRDADAAAYYYNRSLDAGAQLQSLQGLGDIYRSGAASWGVDRVTAARYYGRIYLLEDIPAARLDRVDAYFDDLSTSEQAEVYGSELGAGNVDAWLANNGFARSDMTSRAALSALFSDAVEADGSYRFEQIER
jgi:hypothetical protein